MQDICCPSELMYKSVTGTELHTEIICPWKSRRFISLSLNFDFCYCLLTMCFFFLYIFLSFFLSSLGPFKRFSFFSLLHRGASTAFQGVCWICLVKVLVAQLYSTLCNPMDCGLPGSSVHGILQTRILEWLAIPFSRGSSWPRNWTQVSCTVGSLYHLNHQGSPDGSLQFEISTF